jgi:hypothetical protein
MALTKRDKQESSKKKGAMHNGEVLANTAVAASMGPSQCGNDRPGFGVHSILQKLSAKTYKRVSGF